MAVVRPPLASKEERNKTFTEDVWCRPASASSYGGRIVRRPTREREMQFVVCKESRIFEPCSFHIPFAK